MASSVAIEATNVATSVAYAPGSPIVAMSTPPIAGPTTCAACQFTWLSAMAAGIRSVATRRAIEDIRVGWSTAASPAATNATPNRATTGGSGARAIATKAALQPASPICVAMRSLRRSNASASDPAPNANSMSGMSWAAVSAAIASVEPVRT